MANTLIPVEERSLAPHEVERLDRRRRRGQLFLVIGCQCLVVACLMLLWSGQDATYSPGCGAAYGVLERDHVHPGGLLHPHRHYDPPRKQRVSELLTSRVGAGLPVL